VSLALGRTRQRRVGSHLRGECALPETLIERVKRHLETGATIELYEPSIQPNPPASMADINAAEEQLGFSLPPLVRDLYTQVGDGGYGPGYGLDRLAEVVEMSQEFVTDGPDPWPAKLLHLCCWGCEYFFALDCSRPDGPVLRFVPDEDDNPEALRCEAATLAEWLEDWLRGEPLWDRIQLEFHDLDRPDLLPGEEITDERMIDLARSGKKLDAIKLFRTKHQVGLNEGKLGVEALLAQAEQHATSEPSGSG